eukprot:CAMPEP_0194061950 /NCGR_PEP_ID=MMETSP0009_2-20130614/76062_1 /TAXON_ID=210454 /ORGANISM="Grammatophora oceanica, Strain CCMP 410" /LENGTH=59 /DNA_ID=CAMNT_0038713479 /DNA_START=209 /DNA_END=388 /DNA_ORIENTATION=-
MIVPVRADTSLRDHEVMANFTEKLVAEPKKMYSTMPMTPTIFDLLFSASNTDIINGYIP